MIGDHVSEEELETEELGEQESPAEGKEEPEGEAAVLEKEEEKALAEVSEEEEVIPEEPDNDGKSRLGRRVKKVEDSYDRLVGKMDAFLDAQKPQVQEEELDTDMPVTFGDLDSFIDKREKRKVKKDRDYFDTYAESLVNLSKDLPNDVAEEIFKEHDEHYTMRANLDPATAAHINFLEAKSVVLSRLVASEPVKRNPLKGKRVDLPSGTSGGSRMKGKDTKNLGLDEETKSLIKELGLTEEEAKTALGEDSPTLKTKE